MVTKSNNICQVMSTAPYTKRKTSR